MYSDVDMIAAQATPVNITAPLAVVRVSGLGCWDVLSKCFRPRVKGDVRAWVARYGDWCDEQGVVDDVIVLAYRAPYSYTGQDMLEIFCHGNPLFIDLMMDSMLKQGVRRARPGEFTSRAVINGKMDLLAAESLHVLIESKTRYQADLVRRQVKGPLVSLLNGLVEDILAIQAHIEATIDYGEEDIDALHQDVLLNKVSGLLESFEKLAGMARYSNTMRRGFKVMVVGEPNVGKSTLFNALLRQERAIVTHVPGTTRDMVSEEIEIQGLPVVLIDSAGIRDTNDVVEQIGIDRVFEAIEDVNLVLLLVHGEQVSPLVEKVKTLPGDRWMEVFSKGDLEGAGRDGLVVSAKTGQGLRRLESEIVIRLNASIKGQDVFLFNQRQEEIINQVVESLKSAWEDYRSGFGEEILSSCLGMVRRSLGELTGETTVEDMLDRMFSNFCLGK